MAMTMNTQKERNQEGIDLVTELLNNDKCLYKGNSLKFNSQSGKMEFDLFIEINGNEDIIKILEKHNQSIKE